MSRNVVRRLVRDGRRETPMGERLKVYGWTDYRSGCQLRCIMAAKSRAEVMRLAGITRSYADHSLSETGNGQELEAALAQPRTVLARGLDDWQGSYVVAQGEK